MVDPTSPAPHSTPGLQSSKGRFGRAPLAITSFLMALLAAACGSLASFGSRWGLWSFGTGFAILRWTTYGALAACVLAVVVVVLGRRKGSNKGLVLAAAGFVVGAVVAGVPLVFLARAKSVPAIHDISTDTENPPQFSALLAVRNRAPNGAEYGGTQIAAQQKKGYPDIRPLLLDMSRDRAFQRALDTARGIGWTIVAEDPAKGRIEATDRTFWFGFYDDIVVRVTAAGARSVVDVRSDSRVGRSDVGTNARRIRNFLDALQG